MLSCLYIKGQYLVHALATFIVLSKILNNLAYEFLIPSQLYDVENNRIHKAYWYYDMHIYDFKQPSPIVSAGTVYAAIL